MPTARIARVALLLMFLVCGAGTWASAAARLRVEFTKSGQCVVTGSGPAFRASLAYPRPTAELRCAVPGAPKGETVALEVVLPPGMPRPTGGFPSLDWREQGGRWAGTATLPSAPAFVRVPTPGTPGARLADGLDLLVLIVTAAGIGWALRIGRAT